MSSYPDWFYYPSRNRPPDWVPTVAAVFAAARDLMDSQAVTGLTSDSVLSHLRPGFESMGFQVETGKGKANKIRRPVLYGEQGTELVSYEIDGWHDDHGIVLEREAGRGALGNAVYRDLIRTPLIVDARFLVLGVMIEYHYKSGGKPMAFCSFRDARNILDAI